MIRSTILAVLMSASALNDAEAARWVIRAPRTWVVSQPPACQCAPTCDCTPCQCGTVEAVAYRSPCEGGTCEVGGHATAGACGAGGCATAHHSHGAGLRAGQPVRNVGRMGVGAARVVVRGAGAMARGAAAVVTVRYRARQNHGGPFPLYRAWRCRRGRCH